MLICLLHPYHQHWMYIHILIIAYCGYWTFPSAKESSPIPPHLRASKFNSRDLCMANFAERFRLLAKPKPLAILFAATPHGFALPFLNCPVRNWVCWTSQHRAPAPCTPLYICPSQCLVLLVSVCCFWSEDFRSTMHIFRKKVAWWLLRMIMMRAVASAWIVAFKIFNTLMFLSSTNEGIRSTHLMPPQCHLGELQQITRLKQDILLCDQDCSLTIVHRPSDRNWGFAATDSAEGLAGDRKTSIQMMVNWSYFEGATFK